MFRVVLVNDDATPMELVVKVLMEVFQKTEEEAERIMLTVHLRGKATCGLCVHRHAEELIARATPLASQNKSPRPSAIFRQR
jgi:ATP-dependent Clp protease adaptor protein ClpS